MIIPQKKIEDFSLGLIERCKASKKERMNRGAVWKQYYFNGTNSGKQAVYNLMYPHIDRMSSYLFSPSDVNFRIHFSSGEYSRNVPNDWKEIFAQRFALKKEKPKELKWNDWQEMGKIGAHYLNYEFGRCGVDAAMSSAVDWSLVKGCSFVKTLWGHDGFEPYVIQPEAMGVYREDINGLDRQECFTHTSYITMGQFLQRIKGHPQEQEIIDKVKKQGRSSKPEEQIENDFYHQIIIGGLSTPTSPSSNIKASAQIFGMPTPKLDPKVVQDLLVCHELWVQDDDKEDWTTIQLIEPDIIIEGKLRRRNLTGIKGETYFTQVTANPISGYFWGMSEFSPLSPLQDEVNKRVTEINRILRKRARPAWAITGYSGDSDQAKKTMDTADGVLTEAGPGAKFDKLQPDSPSDAYENLKATVDMFDTVAGFQPIMRGQGEGGVRSGVHAETLVRTASPRMRDRALMIEKQCSDIGDFCFKLLQAKEPRAFVTKDGDEFILSQLPDDIRVHVDSHSASPAFSEDNRQLAFQLMKAGAIDAESLISMVHPPGEDQLIQRARMKAESEAKLLQDHPELLTKGKRK